MWGSVFQDLQSAWRTLWPSLLLGGAPRTLRTSPGLLWSPLRPRQGQGLEVHEEEVELVGPLH